MKANEDVS